MEPSFVSELKERDSILLVGAGGGFDVYCGVPVYMWLRGLGKRVRFASLTFANTEHLEDRPLDPLTVRVSANSAGEQAYFPERSLCRWLASRGIDDVVDCVEKSGVATSARAYQALADDFGADAVVLLDGGADALLRGDESSLGSPAEDAVSVLAAAQLDVPTKQLLCLGFGTDARHGVRHAQVRRRVSELSKDGGFLGTHALSMHTSEGREFVEAVEFAFDDIGKRASYVCDAVAASVRGEFGDRVPPRPEKDAPAWCNVLAAMYFGFDLNEVASRILYGDWLLDTKSVQDVTLRIRGFRKSVKEYTQPNDIPI